MKSSDLFVKCLEAEGVERIFGVPGEENADVMISLLESSVEFVLCRHEQAAAFMADCYGRLTGKAGVCLGTREEQEEVPDSRRAGEPARPAVRRLSSHGLTPPDPLEASSCLGPT